MIGPNSAASIFGDGVIVHGVIVHGLAAGAMITSGQLIMDTKRPTKVTAMVELCEEIAVLQERLKRGRGLVTTAADVWEDAKEMGNALRALRKAATSDALLQGQQKSSPDDVDLALKDPTLVAAVKETAYTLTIPLPNESVEDTKEQEEVEEVLLERILPVLVVD